MAEEIRYQYQNPKTLEPQQFSVSTVNFSKVVANVLVVPHDNPEERNVTVSIQGEADLVDAIDLHVKDDTLFIWDNGRDITIGNPLSISWISSVGRTLMSAEGKSGEVRITRRGGQLIMRLDGKIGIPAQVHVHVPRGISIQVVDVRGGTEIGDTLGPLSIYSEGIARIFAGKVGYTKVDLGGNGQVAIAEVTEWFTASVRGTGSVRVNGGEVKNARIRLSGTGTVYFGGHAEFADISMSGTGNIYIARVDRIEKVNNGLGHLEVGKN